jgi:hypothetical protein
VATGTRVPRKTDVPPSISGEDSTTDSVDLVGSAIVVSYLDPNSITHRTGYESLVKTLKREEIYANDYLDLGEID